MLRHIGRGDLGAAHSVPRGIVRSVWVSGLTGWIMLSAIVLAIPNMEEAAAPVSRCFFYILDQVIPGRGVALVRWHRGGPVPVRSGDVDLGLADDLRLRSGRRLPLSHYCGASARRTAAVRGDLDSRCRRRRGRHRHPYETIAAICAVFLYISYVLPDRSEPSRPRPRLGHAWDRGTLAAGIGRWHG